MMAEKCDLRKTDSSGKPVKKASEAVTKRAERLAQKVKREAEQLKKRSEQEKKRAEWFKKIGGRAKEWNDARQGKRGAKGNDGAEQPGDAGNITPQASALSGCGNKGKSGKQAQRRKMAAKRTTPPKGNRRMSSKKRPNTKFL